MNKFSILTLSSILTLMACNTVEPGNVGVQNCWGTLNNNAFPSGFYYTGTCGMQEMSVRTQTFALRGSESAQNQGQNEGSVHANTSDRLAITIDVTVQFHLDAPQAVPVYRAFGTNYESAVIHPLVRSTVRDVTGSFAAMQLVSERERFSAQIESSVRARLAEALGSRQISSRAVVLDNILINDIDFPQSLDDSIAQVQRQTQATALAVQAQLTARQEAERLRIQADGDAAQLLIRARADAQMAQIRAESQAAANRIIAAALSEPVLRLRQIEAMSSVLSNGSTRVFYVPSNMMLPFQATPTTGQ